MGHKLQSNESELYEEYVILKRWDFFNKELRLGSVPKGKRCFFVMLKLQWISRTNWWHSTYIYVFSDNFPINFENKSFRKIGLSLSRYTYTRKKKATNLCYISSDRYVLSFTLQWTDKHIFRGKPTKKLKCETQKKICRKLAPFNFDELLIRRIRYSPQQV